MKNSNEKSLLVDQIIMGLPVSTLFASDESCYDFDTEDPQDNICAMGSFLDFYSIPENMIEVNDGTQVILKHPLFDYKLQLDCSGRGDFFSHRVETTVIWGD